MDVRDLFAPAGRAALITGGTSGLGHAIAEVFLQNGIDVAVCSRHPDSAADLKAIADREGRKYLSIGCDITNETAVDAMGEVLEEGLGGVTLLVNSAGMNILKPAEEYDAYPAIPDTGLVKSCITPVSGHLSGGLLLDGLSFPALCGTDFVDFKLFLFYELPCLQ